MEERKRSTAAHCPQCGEPAKADYFELSLDGKEWHVVHVAYRCGTEDCPNGPH